MGGAFDDRLREALRARAGQAEGVDDVMGDVDRRARRQTRNQRAAGAALSVALLALVAVAAMPALGPGGDDIEFADPREGEVEPDNDEGQAEDDAETGRAPDDADGEPGDGEPGDGEPGDGASGDSAADDPDESDASDADPEPEDRWCEQDHRGVSYRLRYPEGWWSPYDGEDCTIFHPEPFDAPDDPNQLPGVAIRLTVVDAPLDEAADPSLADVEVTEEREIDGRPALYEEGEEDGTHYTRYLVGVGDRTMVLRTTDAADAGSYEDNRGVLGRMVDSLEIDDPDDEPADDPDDGFDEAAGPVRYEPEEEYGPTILLTEVRVGGHEGFDRVVFEFDADRVPGHEVGYVDPPLRYDPSGLEADVAGDAFLDVSLWPTTARNMGQEPVGETRERIEGDETGSIAEVVRLSDHHRGNQWVIGLDGGERPFRVDVLEDPVRIVVDIER